MDELMQAALAQIAAQQTQPQTNAGYYSAGSNQMTTPTGQNKGGENAWMWQYDADPNTKYEYTPSVPWLSPEIEKYLRSMGYSGPTTTELFKHIPSPDGNWENDRYEQDPNARNVELEKFLADNGLKLQGGVHQVPGASQKTTLQRLIGANNEVMAVDANNDRYSAADRFENGVQLALAAMGAYAAAGAAGLTGAPGGAAGAAGSAGAGAGTMVMTPMGPAFIPAAAGGSAVGATGAAIGSGVSAAMGGIGGLGGSMGGAAQLPGAAYNPAIGEGIGSAVSGSMGGTGAGAGAGAGAGGFGAGGFVSTPYGPAFIPQAAGGSAIGATGSAIGGGISSAIGGGIATLGNGSATYKPTVQGLPSGAELTQGMTGGTGVTGSVPSLGGGGLLDTLKNFGGSVVDKFTSDPKAAQNWMGLLGGVAGAMEGGKDQTATTQQKIDPRMAQYLYGTGYGDPNSMLGAAQQWFQNNRSGMNANMQQGLDTLKNLYTSPGYSQGYTQMRDVGQGLLGRPIAGNPFTQGGLLGAPQQMQAPTQPPRPDIGSPFGPTMEIGGGNFQALNPQPMPSPDIGIQQIKRPWSI